MALETQWVGQRENLGAPARGSSTGRTCSGRESCPVTEWPLKEEAHSQGPHRSRVPTKESGGTCVFLSHRGPKKAPT